MFDRPQDDRQSLRRTPLFANPAAFSRLLDDLIASLVEVESDVVGGIDALGFILAMALALRTQKGLVGWS